MKIMYCILMYYLWEEFETLGTRYIVSVSYNWLNLIWVRHV